MKIELSTLLPLFGPGLALLLGCPPQLHDPAPLPDCVPSEAAFELSTLPILEEKCASCHGSTPQFGAPSSLLDYDTLVEGPEGERLVDKIVQHLSDNTMPPAGSPGPNHNEYDTLIGWASCGLVHPDYGDGLIASQPVWEAPEGAPPGSQPIELTAGNHFVGLDAIDDYQFFTFGGLVAEDLFIQRIEPIVDESRVLHHITLNRMSDFGYLYAWAPGTGAIQFPDGGLRIRPSEFYVLGIHYNNGAGVQDAYDSSGVRLWLGPTEGTEWGMAAPSTWDIQVPPGEVAEATDTCSIQEDFELIAGMPHMHEIGSEFSHVLRRPDGSEETLIELSGWSFELQYFYSMPTLVRAGDELVLTCTYDNPGEQTVYAGEGTSDEMCFNFMYVTPPSGGSECGGL